MLKRIIAGVIALTVFGVPAGALTIYNVQTAVIGWDAAPRMMCSCPTPPCTPTLECPAEGPALGAMYYQVYTKTDPSDETGTKYGAATQDTRISMTFPEGQTVYIGISTIWWGKGLDTSRESSIKSWSNIEADCFNGQTFGFKYQATPLPPIPPPTPSKPENIRVVE